MKHTVQRTKPAFRNVWKPSDFSDGMYTERFMRSEIAYELKVCQVCRDLLGEQGMELDELRRVRPRILKMPMGPRFHVPAPSCLAG